MQYIYLLVLAFLDSLQFDLIPLSLFVHTWLFSFSLFLCECAYVHFSSSLSLFSLMIVCLALFTRLRSISFLLSLLSQQQQRFFFSFIFSLSCANFIYIHVSLLSLSVRASPRRKTKTYLCRIRQIYLCVWWLHFFGIKPTHCECWIQSEHWPTGKTSSRLSHSRIQLPEIIKRYSRAIVYFFFFHCFRKIYRCLRLSQVILRIILVIVKSTKQRFTPCWQISQLPFPIRLCTGSVGKRFGS